MLLQERLKDLEGKYMFIRWAGGSEYGKLIHAGDDFLEFDTINVDAMEYQETLMLREKMILEVVFGGSDISRIIAEVSSKLT